MTFIKYVGPPELHDAVIQGFEHKGDRARVHIRDPEEHRLTIEFLGVTDVHAIRPEGMILYALAEMRADPPLRRFVFSNWDEEGSAALEIVSRDFHVLKAKDQ